jgi:hypothetical protein
MAIERDTAWRSLSADGHVRWLKYSWGPANANALAVRTGAGSGWLVVGAPLGVDEGVYDELAALGGPIALLAPNAFHYLGQREWRRRFPNATSWAPRGSLDRLRAKANDVPWGVAEALARDLPEGIELVFPDGQKSPDILIRITTPSGETVWWLGDLFSNTTSRDQGWPIRIVSRLAGSGPGFRRNSLPELVYLRHRAPWLESVRHAIEARPPSIVVPAHGDPVVNETAARTEAILR